MMLKKSIVGGSSANGGWRDHHQFLAPPTEILYGTVQFSARYTHGKLNDGIPVVVLNCRRSRVPKCDGNNS